MAYASWSVVFGEQPSAAKWNILGTNDASFNDGSGIGTGAITPDKLISGGSATWVATTDSAPSYTGWSSVTTRISRSMKVGNLVYWYFVIDGTSNSTAATITMPYASGYQMFIGGIRVANNGSFSNSPGLVGLAAGSSTASFYVDHSQNVFTAANAKVVQGQIFYYTA